MDYRINLRDGIFAIFNYKCQGVYFGNRFLWVGKNYPPLIKDNKVLGINDNSMPVSLRVCMKLCVLKNCLDKFKEMYYLDKADKQ